jgi:Bacterial PH domain/Short C-terminal domain
MAKIDKLVKEASQYLEPNEPIVASVLGAYETKIMGKDTLRNGVFLATDRRILFYGKKMFGYDLEVFPYANISSFEISKGVLGRSISFFASGNKVKMKWINHGEVDKFIEYVRENVGKKSEAKSSTNAADEIKKLAELKDAGILTEEEFEAKKKQLLGI